jgi:MFS family permease
MLYEGFLVFKNKNYLNFWISNLISNSAIWMQNMACAIILTNISSSPTENSLIQAATTLPLFLFGIISGIIGDKYNKYHILTVIQFALSFLAISIGIFVYKQIMNPTILILMTFLFATMTTLRMPSSQAGIAEVVEPHQIKYAAIMNNLSFNLCRTLGPFIAGIILALFPTYLVFIISCILFGLVGFNFLLYKNEEKTIVKTKVPFKDCVKKIISNHTFRQNCFDAFIIFFSGTYIWSMLPYIARYKLYMTAAGQGKLMAIIGIGALLTVIVLPPLVKKTTKNNIIYLCYFLCFASMLGFLFFIEINYVLTIVFLILFGLGWSMSVAILNGIVQSLFPKEIATRAISIYLMCMYFSQFLGSIWSGFLTSYMSIEFACLSSVTLLFLGFCCRASVHRGAELLRP